MYVLFLKPLSENYLFLSIDNIKSTSYQGMAIFVYSFNNLNFINKFNSASLVANYFNTTVLTILKYT